MKTSRVKLSVINSLVSTITQIVTILLRFVTQTIFIHTLGATYLGINGLFTNIISVLSFADLGIGAAITYSLFQPIAESDMKVVNAIMSFYRKAYHTIAILVAFLGVLLLPYLDFFVKSNKVENIKFIFVLFLFNVVVSYFFSYKQTLLIADQKGYICSIVQCSLLVVKAAGQIFVLTILNNFYLYLVIQILVTVLTNVILSGIISKSYPTLEMNRSIKIPKGIFKQIKGNTLGMIGSKFGEIALSSTDNIIMSMFIGLTTVGVYSNYVLIINSVSTLIMQFLGSVSASIGNFAVGVSDKSKQYQLLERHLYINKLITTIAATCLIGMLNPFIILWVGKKYIFSNTVLYLMILNFTIGSIRQTPITFISAYGLFRKIGFKSIIEAAVNVLVSILMVTKFQMGVDGVLVGTLVSNIAVNWFYEPYVVLHFGINVSGYGCFIKKYFIAFFTVVGACVLNQFVIDLVSFQGIFGLLLNGVISLIISILLILLISHKSDEFRFYSNLIITIFKRRSRY